MPGSCGVEVFEDLLELGIHEIMIIETMATAMVMTTAGRSWRR